MVERVYGTWRQQLQLLEVAAIERQVDDSLMLDQVADGGFVGLERGRRRRDMHGFGHFSNFQRDVDPEGGIDVQLDTGNGGSAKALLRGLQFIKPCAKIGERKYTSLSRGFSGCDVGFQAPHRHGDTWNNRTRRIRDEPDQSCRSAPLAVERRGNPDTAEHEQDGYRQHPQQVLPVHKSLPISIRHRTQEVFPDSYSLIEYRISVITMRMSTLHARLQTAKMIDEK